MKTQQAHVVLLDNHDSFVYNLVDAFAVAGYRCTVLRNSVTVTEVLDLEPDLICLSPGPGHPREAGCMMDLIGASIGTIPILGICLGFQALLEHHGGEVRPCGPVHGTTDLMTLTNPDHPLFAGLSIDGHTQQQFPRNTGANRTLSLPRMHRHPTKHGEPRNLRLRHRTCHHGRRNPRRRGADHQHWIAIPPRIRTKPQRAHHP